MSMKKARENAGKSVAEVMEALNVSDAAVYYWENGTTKPRATLLPKIAALYGCSIDELLSDDQEDG